MRHAGVDCNGSGARFPFYAEPQPEAPLYRCIARWRAGWEVPSAAASNIINDIPTDEDFDVPRLDYAVRVQGACA